jgi:hypothetical protein
VSLKLLRPWTIPLIIILADAGVFWFLLEVYAFLGLSLVHLESINIYSDFFFSHENRKYSAEVSDFARICCEGIYSMY